MGISKITKDRLVGVWAVAILVMACQKTPAPQNQKTTNNDATVAAADATKNAKDGYPGLDENGLALVPGEISWQAKNDPVRIIKLSVLNHETQAPVPGATVSVRRMITDAKAMASLQVSRGHKASLVIRDGKGDKLSLRIEAPGFSVVNQELVLSDIPMNSDMDYPLSLWPADSEAETDVETAALDHVEGIIRFEMAANASSVLRISFLAAEDRESFPQDIRLGFVTPKLYDEMMSRANGTRVEVFGAWQKESRYPAVTTAENEQEQFLEYFIVERYRLLTPK